jgi:Protein of unknown function (DUF3833)
MRHSFLTKHDTGSDRGRVNFRRRLLASLAVIMAMSGSSALNAAPAGGLTLENFFLGPLRGAGSEQDSEHAAARSVTFSGTGTRVDGGVRLVYNVVFSDGEHQHRVWTFVKVAPSTYIGRRADVVGNAQVTQSGNDVHMTYTARVDTKGGPKNLSFDEHFTRTGPRTLVNRLQATYLFLTVASGDITIRRITASAR